MIYDSAKYIAQCNKNKKERPLTSLLVPGAGVEPAQG